MLKTALTTVVLTCLLAISSVTAEEPLNVVFFGNSFTLGAGSSQSVPTVFRNVASAAGHPIPTAGPWARNGWDLGLHLGRLTANPNLLNFPADKQWDFVVMQDLSTTPTTQLGDPQVHRDTALGLFQGVAKHSPNVKAVLFETWARGPGHEFYTDPNPSFPGGTVQMQQETRDGYELSTADIIDFAGPDAARLARVGDAWEIGNWDRLHHTDLWHAQNRGTLLTALVIYGTIYGDQSTSDIDLTAVLTDLNLTTADGLELTSFADAVLLVPEPKTLGLSLAALAFVSEYSRRRLL